MGRAKIQRALHEAHGDIEVRCMPSIMLELPNDKTSPIVVAKTYVANLRSARGFLRASRDVLPPLRGVQDAIAAHPGFSAILGCVEHDPFVTEIDQVQISKPGGEIRLHDADDQ